MRHIWPLLGTAGQLVPGRAAPRTSFAGAWSSFAPANHPSVTVMRFSVSVPVLSEQMAVAPPIVSHAASTRTKLLSCKAEKGIVRAQLLIRCGLQCIGQGRGQRP